MDAIKEMFVSPAWWVSTVMVAIIVNILSSYIKDMLDRLIEKTIAVRKIARAKEEAAEEGFIKRAILDPDHILDLELHAMAYGTTAGKALLFSLLTGILTGMFLIFSEGTEWISPVFMLLIAAALAITSLTSLILGSQYVTRSTKAFNLASEARGIRHLQWYEKIARKQS